MIVSFLYGCSTTKKINAIKPSPDDAVPLVYDNVPSFVSVPVVLKVKDVEQQINKQLNGLIYEDNSLEGDNLAIKLWKLAPITIENIEEGKLKVVLPLKANVLYRFGIDKFGISLSDTREINLSGSVNLMSNVALVDWKLQTQTDLKSIVWNESPTVNIGGAQVSIGYLVNPALKIFRKNIENSIDDAIKKSMDFKPNVLDAMEKIAKPIEMNAEYESWLNVTPIELYATNSLVKDGKIKLDFGLKCFIETYVGAKPELKFDKTKLLMKTVSVMPDKITANIAAISTYADAKRLILKNFQGQEFGDGKRKVTIQNIDLWHKEGKIIIALELLGSINGTVYLTGIPQYNEATKEIFFNELTYILDTKNKLLKSANWLLSGMVLKKIEEKCRYSIQSNLEDGRKQLETYTNNYSPYQGVYVNGNLNEIKFQKIQLTNKAMIAFLNIGGKINISIDGLK